MAPAAQRLPLVQISRLVSQQLKSESLQVVRHAHLRHFWVLRVGEREWMFASKKTLHARLHRLNIKLLHNRERKVAFSSKLCFNFWTVLCEGNNKRRKQAFDFSTPMHLNLACAIIAAKVLNCTFHMLSHFWVLWLARAMALLKQRAYSPACYYSFTNLCRFVSKVI